MMTFAKQPRQEESDAAKRNAETMPSGSVPAAETMFRKSSCACGGGCPSCQAHSGNLRISQPDDAAEIEADQVADRVMRMPSGKRAQAVSFGHSENTIHRKCDACDEDDGVEVQRKPLPSPVGFPENNRDHVQSVISSGGRPLDEETRSFFEPRLGYDLANVRIHTEIGAEESARAIDAKAYTRGSHIVFGRGEYRPDSEEGKHLLAHELVHTTQGNYGANRHTIHRYPGAGAVRPPLRAPPIRNYWTGPGTAKDQRELNRLGKGNAVVGAPTGSGPGSDPRDICTDQGRDTDWGACAALRESQGKFRVMQRDKIKRREKPVIVLSRGGSASTSFVEKGQPRTERYYDAPELTYTPHNFHIIDAMEHDFELSTSHIGDQVLYMLYFPELKHEKIEGGTQSDIDFLSGTVRVRVSFDPDPDSVPKRLEALEKILDRRMVRIKARVNQHKEEKIRAEAETATLAHKGKQRVEGACSSKKVKRKGGHDRHDKYAEHVAKEKGFGKVSLELEYETPEGVTYSFDVYNPANEAQVWEVKTMHDWAGPDKIAIAPRILKDKSTKLPNMSDRIASLESQRLRGIYVSTRCGLKFRYAFDNCEAYRGFKEQWVLPLLEYIPYPGEKKEDCND